MSAEVKMEFKPEGFAECLSGMSGMVQAECERMAMQAGGLQHYTISVSNEPRFQDASYGVSRPIARAIPVGHIIADESATADEAENKTMSKAVY